MLVWCFPAEYFWFDGWAFDFCGLGWVLCAMEFLVLGWFGFTGVYFGGWLTWLVSDNLVFVSGLVWCVWALFQVLWFGVWFSGFGDCCV